jgi:hypothetical protein
MQTPVTTFNNPKASLSSSTPNSFSINQLLTPPSSFTPLAPSMVGADDKDYRAYAHHPHLLSSIPFPSDPTRPDSKHPMDGRAPYPSPLTSYLPPEDDPRHLDGTPLLHPPSTDPYYYHKAAALAYQYHYPRQMLPPSYPPPPHVMAPHLARNPYYHPFGVPPPHESPRQQHMIANEPHNGQQPQQQVQQVGDGQEGERAQQQQQQTQQPQPTQQQTTTTQTTAHTIITTVTNASKQQAAGRQPSQTQPQVQSQEALPKMNIPTSSTDMYKYSRPPSPSSSSLPPPSYATSGGDMSHYYFSQFPQQQRLHQQ